MMIEKNVEIKEKLLEDGYGAPILFVDDLVSQTHYFEQLFKDKFIVHTANSGEEALEILREHQDIQVVCSDQRMEDNKMTGVELLKQVKDLYPQMIRILLTAYCDFDCAKEAINNVKAFMYLNKPWEEKQLHQVFKQAITHATQVRNILQQRKHLNHVLHDLNNAAQLVNFCKDRNNIDLLPDAAHKLDLSRTRIEMLGNSISTYR